MVKRLLLDTSIIIDYLRKKDKEQTLLFSFIKDGYELYISIVTHTEIYAGKSVWERKDVLAAVESILKGLILIPLSVELSIKSGQTQAMYHDNSLIDCIIAATAIENNLLLATLNTKDFKRIAGLMLHETK